MQVLHLSQQLKLSSGFLTLLYSFYVWVNVATYTTMDDRESGLRNVLISNGLRRSALVLGYIVTEAIFCLVIVIIGQVLYQIDHAWEWPFFYKYVNAGQLFICQLLFGLNYLILQLLFSRFMKEKFSIMLSSLLATTVLFLLFGNKEQSPDIKNPDAHYFYFGFNIYLKSIHNVFISAILLILLLTLYLSIELVPHSRTKSKQERGRRLHSRRLLGSSKFQSFRNTTQVKQSSIPVLELNEVTHKYGEVTALQNISLTFYQNEIYLIVGKNGSGKSTLLRLLASQETPTMGVVQADIGSVGYCHQQNNLPSECTVSELFEFFFSINGKGFKKEEREACKQDLFRELGLLHHQKSAYGSLSIGMKRKCGLMIALIHSPQVLLLDEPVSGLDAEFQEDFWQILNKLKTRRSIIVVTHDINQAVADKCVILHQGRVLQLFNMSELKAKCSYYYRLQARSRNNNMPVLKEKKTNIQGNESSCITLQKSSNFVQYKVMRDDFQRLRKLIAHHHEDQVILATVTLEEEVMAIVESVQDDVVPPQAWDLLLKDKLHIFETRFYRSSCAQFCNLWLRRSHTLWLTPRMTVSVVLIVALVWIEVFFMKMRLQFIPYRLQTVLTFFIYEDAVQRYYHVKLNAYLSGTTKLTYHCANILADSLLLACVFFFSYLVFTLYNTTLTEQIQFDDHNMIPFTLLGSISTICFCHVLAITIKHPMLAQGLLHLPLSYFLFFIFNFTPFPLYIFPSILYAYSILHQSDQHLFLTYASVQTESNYPFYILQIIHIIFYFSLLFLMDSISNRHLRISNSPVVTEIPIDGPPPSTLKANFKDRYLKKFFQFSLAPANILCLYGPPESGKSTLVNLLSKLLPQPRNRYSGRCEVMGSNYLAKHPSSIPLGSVSLYLFDPYLTACQHLWLIGRLRSIPRRTLQSQIFFITKLLQLDRYLFKKICQLSGGNRRKVSVACALLGSPNLLLIDEPTRSLDPRVGKTLLLGLQYFVHRLQCSLLFTSKKVEEHLLIADSVLQMSSKSHQIQKHKSRALSEIFSIKIVYCFLTRRNAWQTSFQVSPLSTSQSCGVSDIPSQTILEEIHARTFSFKQLKEQLVDFLKALSEHDGLVRQILIN